MTEVFEVAAVGWVRSTRAEVVDDDWDAVEARIELDTARFGPDALAGLAEFSHVEVLFLFDQVDPDGVHTGARHPRGRRDWPAVGIFAQRAKDRPNRIALIVCRVAAVDGTVLHVEGLDAVDGTPVLDIKPWMHGFAPRGSVTQPPWATELMRDYW